jgi:hypothetical protein
LLKTWVFSGIGAAYVVGQIDAPAPTTLLGDSPDSYRSTRATGALLEVPIGVGAGYRIDSDWTVESSLSARLAIASWGPLYRANEQPGAPAFGGHELLAVWLTIGISYVR